MEAMVVLDVLSAYPAEYHPHRLEYLGFAGGFSGAQFWKIEARGGLYCLRRWPAGHPSDEQLALIHAALRWAADRGCHFIPVPQPTRQGRTFVTRGASRWELSPWMPGKADYQARPSRAKLEAAMRALAAVHRAIADFPWPHDNPSVAPAGVFSGQISAPPSLRQRLEKLTYWSERLGAEVREGLPEIGWSELQPLANRALELATQAIPQVQPLLEQATHVRVRLQACLGDVWHDHVLFSGEQVTGLVDFGSMRLDTVAGDIARLLGSLVLDDHVGWQIGLAAYEEVAGRLDPTERWLIEVFDRSTVVLAPLNWIQWIYFQRRQFEDQLAIVARMRQWVERLEAAIRGGRPHPAVPSLQTSGFHGQVQLP